MSIQVNDFQWEPGKNDAEYIKLLESSRDEWQKIAQKAIAKLKALSKAQQEPRVMTREEVKQLERGALIAYEAKGLELGEDGKNHFVIVCHAAEYNSMDSRGIIWFHGGIGIKGIYDKTVRCWTSRPTDEQRQAVKWK